MLIHLSFLFDISQGFMDRSSLIKTSSFSFEHPAVSHFSAVKTMAQFARVLRLKQPTLERSKSKCILLWQSGCTLLRLHGTTRRQTSLCLRALATPSTTHRQSQLFKVPLMPCRDFLRRARSSMPSWPGAQGLKSSTGPSLQWSSFGLILMSIGFAMLVSLVGLLFLELQVLFWLWMRLGCFNCTSSINVHAQTRLAHLQHRQAVHHSHLHNNNARK